MRLSIMQKLIALGLLLTVLPVAIMGGTVFFRGQYAVEQVEQESKDLVHADLDHTLHGIISMLKAQQELLEKMVSGSLNVTFELAEKEGGISEAYSTYTWSAINQYTKQATQIELPRFLIGSTELGQIRDFSEKSPLVDDVTRLVGGTCTIFQRMNEAGDMLRVATSVQKLDGSRAVGTYIPAVNPDGKPNPVISKVMAGERYVGRAYVVNAWYVTAYEPFYDSSNRIIGVLYYGIKEENTETLRRQIMDLEIGETGYAYVLDSSGTYVISDQGKDDGKTIIDSKDADGNLFIQEMIQRAKELEPGETDYMTYPWKDAQGRTRTKAVSFTYFQKWDWIVAAGAFEDELMTAVNKMTELEHDSLFYNLLIAILSLLAAAIIWYFSAKRFVRPINSATATMVELARGDLHNRLNNTNHDEVGTLSRAIDTFSDKLQHLADILRRVGEGDLGQEVPVQSQEDELALAARSMVENMRRLVGAAGRTAEEIDAEAENLSDSSRNLSEGATSQAATLEELTSSMTEVSSQTESNAENARLAGTLAEEAKNAALKGKQEMANMVEAMNEINESGQAIFKIIKVIDEIAFQTNLLALNAAVEAARAGKHGKGFAVVAEEVRNLAGRSAKAAQETGELIQGSVEKGEKGSYIADLTSEALEAIVEAVTKAADLVAEIDAASNEQVQGVAEVNQGLRKVDDVTQQYAAHAEQTASAASQLADRSATLKEILSRFRMAEKDTGHAPTAGQTAPAVAKDRSQPVSRTRDDKVLSPKDVIALDDDEFGKY